MALRMTHPVLATQGSLATPETHYGRIWGETASHTGSYFRRLCGGCALRCAAVRGGAKHGSAPGRDGPTDRLLIHSHHFSLRLLRTRES